MLCSRRCGGLDVSLTGDRNETRGASTPGPGHRSQCFCEYAVTNKGRGELESTNRCHRRHLCTLPFFTMSALVQLRPLLTAFSAPVSSKPTLRRPSPPYIITAPATHNPPSLFPTTPRPPRSSGPRSASTHSRSTRTGPVRKSGSSSPRTVCGRVGARV